jgi:2-hydroxyacyl-CoA lyase 1
LLAGSSETHLVSRGAFQELDAVSLLTPHTKLAIRPPSLESIPDIVTAAYRNSWYGQPGTGFVDLPADVIQGKVEDAEEIHLTAVVPLPPRGGVDLEKLAQVVSILKTAKAPLIVVGKGAAYAQAEAAIRQLVDRAQIPFLPTPMGKGVLPDSHPLNTASARSTALKEADVVLILGARLNWILHFGDAPKWNPHATFIQIDISADELARSSRTSAFGLVGDLATVVPQLIHFIGSWRYNPSCSSYTSHLTASARKNEINAMQKSTVSKNPMSYARVFHIIKETLHSLSPASEGGIVYVSEGANTMDISRSIFPVEYPRLRLDAGTHATMGVGLGYAIAAHAAYNSNTAEATSGPAKRKKIVALEGDSAFGFSAMEVETMARYDMDILIFVINNGGVYHGDSDNADEWLALQKATASHDTAGGKGGLRSTSLGWEVGYEKIAEMCGGLGFLVRTEEQLEKATREGYKAGRVTVVNVIVEAGKGAKLEFGWQASGKKEKGKRATAKL